MTTRLEKRSRRSIGWFSLATAVACGSLNDGQVIIITDAASGSSSNEAGESSNGGSSSNGAGGEGGELTGAAGTPAVEGQSPTVVSVSPEDQESGVDRELGTIVLEFSEPIEPSTVTEDSVRVLDGESSVPGELEVTGATVTFTPATPLALLAEYTVGVTTEVTDTQGEALEANFSATFATADGAWGEVIDVDADTDYGGLGSVTLATAANGDVLVGFVRPETDEAVTRWYRRGTGWEAPETHNAQSTTGAQMWVSVNDAGDAALSFTERDAAGERYYLQRYSDGAWQTRVLLGNLGNLRVLRGQNVLTSSGLVALTAVTSNNEVSLGYSLPTGELSFEGTVLFPNVRSGGLGADAEGRALFVYRTHVNGQPGDVRFTRFNPDDVVWSDPAATLPNSLGASAPDVAVRPTGEAMAIWVRSVTGDVVASYFEAASGWSEPATLDTLAGAAYLSRDSIVADGRGFRAIWSQDVTASLTNLYSSRFDADSETWSEPELVSDGNSPVSSGLPSLAMDSRGNSLVTWAQGQDTAYRGWFNRYDAVAGQWLGAEQMPDNLSIFTDTACVVSADGLGFAFWTKGVTSGFEFWAAPFE